MAFSDSPYVVVRKIPGPSMTQTLGPIYPFISLSLVLTYVTGEYGNSVLAAMLRTLQFAFHFFVTSSLHSRRHPHFKGEKTEAREVSLPRFILLANGSISSPLFSLVE